MTVALVAAAGSGVRLKGDVPKALVPLGGRPLLAWCLAALEDCRTVARAVVAAPPGHESDLARVAATFAPNLETDVVTGAQSRSGSVARALSAAGDSELVVVHDAARPLVTAELIDRCVEQLERLGCAGVVAAARATDTIKEADSGGHVIATLERSNLWAAQTPQVFRAEALRVALSGATLERASDDAQLVEAMGADVRVVEAPRQNLKVTTGLDLRLAELLLSARG
jgi:2-C-methyl-D-erythritol 4-phosphate cytidylyltransferase